MNLASSCSPVYSRERGHIHSAFMTWPQGGLHGDCNSVKSFLRKLCFLVLAELILLIQVSLVHCSSFCYFLSLKFLIYIQPYQSNLNFHHQTSSILGWTLLQNTLLQKELGKITDGCTFKGKGHVYLVFVTASRKSLRRLYCN